MSNLKNRGSQFQPGPGGYHCPLQKQEQQLHGFLAAALGPRRAILERFLRDPPGCQGCRAEFHLWDPRSWHGTDQGQKLRT
ncbi:hypothetical protein CapIbe_016824 [Capra ibex]